MQFWDELPSLEEKGKFIGKHEGVKKHQKDSRLLSIFLVDGTKDLSAFSSYS